MRKCAAKGELKPFEKTRKGEQEEWMGSHVLLLSEKCPNNSVFDLY